MSHPTPQFKPLVGHAVPAHRSPSVAARRQSALTSNSNFQKNIFPVKRIYAYLSVFKRRTAPERWACDPHGLGSAPVSGAAFGVSPNAFCLLRATFAEKIKKLFRHEATEGDGRRRKRSPLCRLEPVCSGFSAESRISPNLYSRPAASSPTRKNIFPTKRAQAGVSGRKWAQADLRAFFDPPSTLSNEFFIFLFPARPGPSTIRHQPSTFQGMDPRLAIRHPHYASTPRVTSTRYVKERESGQGFALSRRATASFRPSTLNYQPSTCANQAIFTQIYLTDER